MQIDRMPKLRALEFELDVLRALLSRPERHLLYTKHYTIAKNRWIGFERVARAAMRDGFTSAEAARLLIDLHAECSKDGYHFTAACAAWIVASQSESPKAWVIKPETAKRSRVVGVAA